MIAYCTITQENGQQLLNDTFGRLLDQLAPHFATIYFIASSAAWDDKSFYPQGRSSYTYRVRAENVAIVEAAASDARDHLLKKALVSMRRLPTYFVYIRESDFVYITMPGFSGFLAHLVCRLLRKPYCLYYGSDWQEVALFMADWRGPLRLLYAPYLHFSRWAESVAVKHARFTVVHGKKLAGKFRGLGAVVVETIPMISVTPDDFYDRDDTCQTEEIECLYVGALIPRKGIEYLLEAVRRLLSRGQSLRLRLVGAGDYDYVALLKRKVEALNLQSRVEFSGHVADLKALLRLYRRADLFIIPTLGEGFPRVIYEAMSQGLPVVCTSLDTIRSTLKDQEHALLVAPSSYEALAIGIETLIKEPELRQSLIQSGYAFAHENVGRETAAVQLIKLIGEYGGQLRTK